MASLSNGVPSTASEPDTRASEARRPPKHWSSVVLPEPAGPRSAVNVPRCTDPCAPATAAFSTPP